MAFVVAILILPRTDLFKTKAANKKYAVIESYAWAPNGGWLVLNNNETGAEADGVNLQPIVGGGSMLASGYGFAPNMGWVNFQGVSLTENGNKWDFSGSAWGPNAGWVNFNNAIGANVYMDDETGEVHGSAWSPNSGWISFCDDTVYQPGQSIENYYCTQFDISKDDAAPKLDSFTFSCAGDQLLGGACYDGDFASTNTIWIRDNSLVYVGISATDQKGGADVATGMRYHKLYLCQDGSCMDPDKLKYGESIMFRNYPQERWYLSPPILTTSWFENLDQYPIAEYYDDQKNTYSESFVASKEPLISGPGNPDNGLESGRVGVYYNLFDKTGNWTCGASFSPGYCDSGYVLGVDVTKPNVVPDSFDQDGDGNKIVGPFDYTIRWSMNDEHSGIAFGGVSIIDVNGLVNPAEPGKAYNPTGGMGEEYIVFNTEGDIETVWRMAGGSFPDGLYDVRFRATDNVGNSKEVLVEDVEVTNSYGDTLMIRDCDGSVPKTRVTHGWVDLGMRPPIPALGDITGIRLRNFVENQGDEEGWGEQYQDYYPTGWLAYGPDDYQNGRAYTSYFPMPSGGIVGVCSSELKWWQVPNYQGGPVKVQMQYKVRVGNKDVLSDIITAEISAPWIDSTYGNIHSNATVGESAGITPAMGNSNAVYVITSGGTIRHFTSSLGSSGNIENIGDLGYPGEDRGLNMSNIDFDSLKGAAKEIGSNFQDYKMDNSVFYRNGSLVVREGSFSGKGTVLVEGDLLFDGNTFYVDDTATSTEEIDSVAFIVKGNITFGDGVRHAVGVMVAGFGEQSVGNKGVIRTGSSSSNTNSLIVQGALIGRSFKFNRESSEVNGTAVYTDSKKYYEWDHARGKFLPAGFIDKKIIAGFARDGGGDGVHNRFIIEEINGSTPSYRMYVNNNFTRYRNLNEMGVANGTKPVAVFSSDLNKDGKDSTYLIASDPMFAKQKIYIWEESSDDIFTQKNIFRELSGDERNKFPSGNIKGGYSSVIKGESVEVVWVEDPKFGIARYTRTSTNDDFKENGNISSLGMGGISEMIVSYFERDLINNENRDVVWAYTQLGVADSPTRYKRPESQDLFAKTSTLSDYGVGAKMVSAYSYIMSSAAERIIYDGRVIVNPPPGLSSLRLPSFSEVAGY